MQRGQLRYSKTWSRAQQSCPRQQRVLWVPKAWPHAWHHHQHHHQPVLWFQKRGHFYVAVQYCQHHRQRVSHIERMRTKSRRAEHAIEGRGTSTSAMLACMCMQGAATCNRHVSIYTYTALTSSQRLSRLLWDFLPAAAATTAGATTAGARTISTTTKSSTIHWHTGPLCAATQPNRGLKGVQCSRPKPQMDWVCMCVSVQGAMSTSPPSRPTIAGRICMMVRASNGIKQFHSWGSVGVLCCAKPSLEYPRPPQESLGCRMLHACKRRGHITQYDSYRDCRQTCSALQRLGCSAPQGVSSSSSIKLW